MNFASWSFVGLFLPLVLGAFLLIRGKRRAEGRQALLIAASLLFYGVSGAANLAMLGASIALNFAAGRALAAPRPGQSIRRAIMWSAVIANVGALLAYKVLALDSRAIDGFLSAPEILIPLALSFITFQQIGFVVATYRRSIRHPDLFDYLFFVAFFPQLILGPIVQYGHIAAQLREGALARVATRDIAVGLAIFVLGLSKKVLLADQMALPVNSVFDGVLDGNRPATLDAWFAISGFQFQLFLDFSAYAEMAIGLARMFGIALPINFDEPYKSVNRFDLWRRWHITFVVFMRTHVFMPLVRHWRVPPTAAIVVTALLSGLWHGLGWTFVLWAIVQSAILLALHWRGRRRRQVYPTGAPALVWAIATTFLVTCLLGTLFRAPTLDAAEALYGALMGLGAGGPSSIGPRDWLVFTACAVLIWALPSASRLFGGDWTAVDPRPEVPRTGARELVPVRFRLSAGWGATCALLLILTFFYLGESQRFVYVQF